MLDVFEISGVYNRRNDGVLGCAKKKRNTGYLNEDHVCFTWGVWESDRRKVLISSGVLNVFRSFKEINAK